MTTTIIVRDGFNISPQEVEEAIYTPNIGRPKSLFDGMLKTFMFDGL